MLLTPTGRDAELTATIFRRAGIYSFACTDLEDVCEKFHDGVGALLIAEEVIPRSGRIRSQLILRRAFLV